MEQVNEDTISLLKACNSGTKTATNSIEQVMEYVKDKSFSDKLHEYNKKHVEIGDKCHTMLNKYGVEEEDPSAMTKMMTWMTTEWKMMVNKEDQEIAKIMSDGCNMGVQKIAEYMNKYTKANENARTLASELIEAELKFMKDILMYF